MNCEPQRRRVLGVDLSSSLGWAVFDIRNGREELLAVGLKKTAKEAKQRGILTSFDDIRRGMELAEEIRRVVKEYHVGGIVVEVPTGSQSASAAKALGIAKGIIASVAVYLNVQVDYITPTDLKRTVTGKSVATKEEVWEFARRRHPEFEGWPRKKNGEFPAVAGTLEHIADACVCVATAVEKHSNLITSLDSALKPSW